MNLSHTRFLKTLALAILPLLLIIVIAYTLLLNSGPSDVYSVVNSKLETKEYSTSNTPEAPCSIIIYDNNNKTIYSMEDYTPDKNDTINLDINPNTHFIISLHSYPTIDYSWKIANSIDDMLLRLENTSYIDTTTKGLLLGFFSDDKEKSSTNRRQNFYFLAESLGSQTLTFENKSENGDSDEIFKLNININITK